MQAALMARLSKTESQTDYTARLNPLGKITQAHSLEVLDLSSSTVVTASPSFPQSSAPMPLGFGEAPLIALQYPSYDPILKARKSHLSVAQQATRKKIWVAARGSHADVPCICTSWNLMNFRQTYNSDFCWEIVFSLNWRRDNLVHLLLA